MNGQTAANNTGKRLISTESPDEGADFNDGPANRTMPNGENGLNGHHNNVDNGNLVEASSPEPSCMEEDQPGPSGQNGGPEPDRLSLGDLDLAVYDIDAGEVQTCAVCGGFYGPNFGQPLCATCHAFLHPEDVNSFWPMPYYTGSSHAPPHTHGTTHRLHDLPGPSHHHHAAGVMAPLVPQENPVPEDTGTARSESGDSGNEDLDPPPLEGENMADDDDDPQANGHDDDPQQELGMSSGSSSSSSLDEMGPLADNLSMSSSGGSGDEGQVPPNPVLGDINPDDLPGPSGLNGPTGPGPRLAEQILMLTDTRRAAALYSGLTLKPGTAENLPIDLLMNIFAKLDDLSLWVCSRTCQRWFTVIQSFMTDSNWREFLAERWPIFPLNLRAPADPAVQPRPDGGAYYDLYCQLVNSAPCLQCLFSVKPDPNFLASEVWRPPWLVTLDENTEQRWRQRIRSEWKSLQSELHLIEGIDARPLDQKYQRWMAAIDGPAGSPYEQGRFYLLILVPDLYPMRPPVVRFLTRIFHPNISLHGDVGLDVLQHNWSLALTLSKVILSIQSLLTDPNADICMEPAIGRMCVQEPARYEAIARAWTERFAKAGVGDSGGI